MTAGPRFVHASENAYLLLRSAPRQSSRSTSQFAR
ncbi:hypothetical protein BX265_5053 [Streptomyces sp. TLI_235]|nr:hypothetical protein BX265_5053 [Streptomyces sp. TLI_235]